MPSIEDAIAHINRYSTKNSEAIVTRDEASARLFLRLVDSAVVYWNASTRFSDGGEFGFGAEMGISTQKLHCRGPFALAELTSAKYEVIGNGQVRLDSPCGRTLLSAAFDFELVGQIKTSKAADKSVRPTLDDEVTTLLQAGDMAPDFEVPVLIGGVRKQFRLSEHRGKRNWCSLFILRTGTRSARSRWSLTRWNGKNFWPARPKCSASAWIPS